jgi:hypothetical protein
MNTIINTLAAAGSTDIEAEINSLSVNSVLIAALVLVVLLLLATQVVKNKKLAFLKTPLFVAIAATIVIPSLLLMGSTVYVNTISESKGPVHWHTDIEFWVCGEEIELRNPTGFLSNKIGTSTYHEHDDKRIHLEGVVIEKEYDASLEKFMDVTDGFISDSRLVIATEESIFENDTDGDIPSGNQDAVREYLVRNEDGLYQIAVENGQTCDESQPGEVQVFLLRYNEGSSTYTQTKLEEPERYIMRDESIVPPGDCVIVEFDVSKTSTDRLCQQYGVRDVDRCTEFGVSEFNPDLCNIKQEIITENVNQIPEQIEEIQEALIPPPSEAEQNNTNTAQEGDL